MRKTLQILSFVTINLLFLGHFVVAQCDNISPDGPFCEGETIVFTADGTMGCAGMKDWSYDLGSGVMEVTSIDLELTFTSPGDITVSVLDAPGGTVEVSEVFTVNAKPSIFSEVNFQDNNGWIAATTAEVCDGYNEIRFRSSLNNGGATFEWLDPNGTTILNERRLDLEDIELSDAGLYQIIYTENGCSDTASVDLTVFPLPDVTMPVADVTENYCSGTTPPNLSFTLSGESPYNLTYTRDGGSPTTVNNVTNPFEIMDAMPGEYVITAVTDANGCSTEPGFMSNSITLVENPTPDVTMPSSDEVLSYCIGQSIPDVSFTLSGNGPYSVTYTTNGGSPTTETNQSSPFVISGASPGQYVITSITSSDGCTTPGGFMSNSITLVQTTSPDVSNPSTDITESYCEGDAVPQLSFSLTGTGPFTVTYTINGGSSVTVNNQPSPLVITNGMPGEYVITSIVDATGCSTAMNYMSNSITLEENALPDVMPQYNLFDGNGWIFGNAVEVCEGEELGLASHPVFSAGYTWNGPNGFSSTDRVLNFNPVSSNQNGVFTVTFMDTNGCSDSDVIAVTVNSLPTASIVITEDSGVSNNDGTICDGDMVTLVASGGVSYLWNDANNTNINKIASGITYNIYVIILIYCK